MSAIQQLNTPAFRRVIEGTARASTLRAHFRHVKVPKMKKFPKKRKRMTVAAAVSFSTKCREAKAANTELLRTALEAEYAVRDLTETAAHSPGFYAAGKHRPKPKRARRKTSKKKSRGKKKR